MIRCGLLGHRLSHSYSPIIHEVFGGYSYELFEVEPENLSGFMSRRDIHGFNITVPYKRDVIPFCNELSETARSVGSVNTILRRADDSLYGDNTDVYGFSTQVKRSGIVVQGKKVLILGSGGSSLTALHVMHELQAEQIIVVSRGGEDNYENICRHKDASIIVNTTPVGMYPHTGKSPVDIGNFERLEGVLDLVYNPARTQLLMDAKMLRIPHLGGLTMLVGQARAASEMFSGQKVSIEQEDSVVRMLRRKMENIILIGMPGCGKSVIGKLLAENTGKKFVDADSAIEEAAGVSIPEIFIREGESGFRKRESEVLETLGKQSGLVIATGGGCVTRRENYAHLHQNGTIIFIERDISKLERKGRPLSQGNLQEMYVERLPLYREFADITVQNNGQISTAAQKIKEAVYENTRD